MSFIEGSVPTDLGWHDARTLRAAAELVRKYHNATTGWLPPNSAGQFEVVCHNDLSPCNFVFVAGAPTAIIDFDAAAPGSRRADVAYAAWLWLDLGNPEISASEQCRRLRLFVSTYDQALDVSLIKHVILDRQEMLGAEGECTGQESLSRWARACRIWTMENL